MTTLPDLVVGQVTGREVEGGTEREDEEDAGKGSMDGEIGGESGVGMLGK